MAPGEMLPFWKVGRARDGYDVLQMYVAFSAIGRAWRCRHGCLLQGVGCPLSQLVEHGVATMSHKGTLPLSAIGRARQSLWLQGRCDVPPLQVVCSARDACSDSLSVLPSLLSVEHGRHDGYKAWCCLVV